MGHEAIYKCNKCGNEFKSQEGGGFFFAEYRCIKCDSIKAVCTHRLVPPEHYKEPTIEEIGVCEECGGALRDDVKPMCPKCRHRYVSETKVLTYYD